MSYSIYYTYFHTPLPAHRFSHLLDKIPDRLKAHVLRFKRWQDAHAALLGKHLLLKAMSDLGYSYNLHDLGYTEYGRPFIQGATDFNISHSGPLVVCIISTIGKIGIDIEEKVSINPHDYEGQFSPEEWKAITAVDSPENLFYKYWTVKEAVLKADGRGISTSLCDLNVFNKPFVEFDNRKWYILEVPDFKNHACNIASSIYIPNYKLHRVDFEL